MRRQQRAYMEQDARNESEGGCELEIEDMRGPDSTIHQWPLWRAQPLRTQPAPLDERLWQGTRAAGVTLIVLVVLVRLLPSGFFPGGSAGPSPQSVDLLAVGDNIGCLVDAAWSPDGQRVAILGYQYGDGCPDQQFVPAQITIYAIAPTTVLARIPVDGMLAAAIHPWATESRTAYDFGDRPGRYRYPRIRYYDLVWSRDGQRLTARFSVLFSANGGTTAQPPHVGVMLLDPHGKHPQVIQLGYAASMQLAPQWDNERAAQVSTVPMTPTYPYDYAPATPVLDTAIALRPDGRELASFSGGSTVDLFDTANGRRVASLIPRVGPHWFSGRTALLRWAPGGTHLLLASGILGSVTVWRR